ncbi:MAG: helix-turn-helix transcriptional regulator [Clostridia bacterium]|nr:helix-turn-helix transcriptional regulator [Clostridia bacterium]
MELNIGRSIRRLRAEKNITQDELAIAIGVTAQAVSKWERAEGYPDITLLPEIAAYFDVTLDNLCGLDEQRDQSEICRIHAATMHASSYDEGVRIAREGLAKYPYSYRLKKNLAFALRGCPGKWTPPKEILDEIIRLYEDIIEHCTDQELVFRVLAEIWEVYEAAGEHEKAIKSAARLPGFYETSDRVMTFILHGEKRVSHVQNSVIGIMPHIDHMLRSAMETDCYSTEEKITLCRKMIGIYGLIDECRDWPVGMIFSYQLWHRIAVLSMEIGDTDGCMTALRNAAELAVHMDSMVFEGYPKSLLLNRIDFEYLSGEQNDRKYLREMIEKEPAFDPIRETPEYTEIMAELTE